MTPPPNPVLAAVLSRRSAARLAEPAPGRDDLERLVQAAATAPDHGRLRPWRLVPVSGDERVRLGDALGEAASSPEQARRATAKRCARPCSFPSCTALYPATRRSPGGNNWPPPRAW